MQTKTGQVRTALRKCLGGYAALGEDIRQVSERTEELWFQMDDLVHALQEAEHRKNLPAVERSLQALLRCALSVESEVRFVRGNR